MASRPKLRNYRVSTSANKTFMCDGRFGLDVGENSQRKFLSGLNDLPPTYQPVQGFHPMFLLKTADSPLYLFLEEHNHKPDFSSFAF